MTKIILAICVVIGFFGISVAGIFLWVKSGGLEKIISEKAINLVGENSSSTIGSTDIDVKNALHSILGFDKKRTYLFLFLNNTELRPGGGFIGVYGLVEVNKGVPSVVEVQGTEILDGRAPKNFESVPPQPLAYYLDIDRWLFRDSNWSPDFKISSQKTLDLYKKEGGVGANEVDAIIGITPTVLEEVLRITGPIEYEGITFSADNFIKTLEYEVEYGYAEKGIHFNDRKKIISGLTKKMVKKIGTDIFSNWSSYQNMVNKMVEQKHIMVYTDDSATQKIIELKKMAGRVKDSNGDYLLYVDANLGALKTDAAMRRHLTYSFEPEKDKYIATVTMEYRNTGDFDWRTTRYRSYARIFVPKGSQFISVEGGKNSNVDQGIELGKKWFGTFVVIEPKQEHKLIWKYYVDNGINDTLKKGNYQLEVQKQLGTIGHGLSLDLDFATKLKSATPSELANNHGDSKYSYTTNLEVDRKFNVKY